MKIETAIPPLLRGRGHNECVPMKCSGCSEQFLLPASDGSRQSWNGDVVVTCPRCKQQGTFAADALRDAIRNGQAAA